MKKLMGINPLPCFLLLLFIFTGCKKDDDTASPAKPNLKNKIVFNSNRSGVFSIFSMNLDGSDPKMLTNTSSTISAIDVSRDGTRVAFIREGNIFVVDADGQNEVQLTLTENNYMPRWSPDGSKIAFYSSRGGGKANIYVMNVDGSNVVKFNDGTSNGYFGQKWSPDGKKLCFAGTSGVGGLSSYEIYSANADGSNFMRLTNNTGEDGEPRWSPDGSKIVYQSERDGNFEMYSMNADGTGAKRLTNEPKLDFRPAFSPDGSKIAFLSYRDFTGEIFLMNYDGTGLRQLTFFDDFNSANNIFIWSSDGKSVVFTNTNTTPGGTGNSDIFAINIDGTGLTNLTSNAGNNGNPCVVPF